jgi:hypothetical protein
VTEEPQTPAESRVEPTGNLAVDEVLELIDALHDAPVSGHVAVFESAHERLRGALSDAGDDRS